jgi:hypothetical protein
MLKYELNRAESILIIMPDGPLKSADFEKLIQEVDPYIKEKGILKDWGLFVGESHGYSVVQGTEVEVIKAIQRYTPFIYFASHPIATVNQAGEMIKALTK